MRRRGGGSVGAEVVHVRADSGADEDRDSGHHEGADDARAAVMVPRDARGQVWQAGGGAAVNKLEIQHSAFWGSLARVSRPVWQAIKGKAKQHFLGVTCQTVVSCALRQVTFC